MMDFPPLYMFLGVGACLSVIAFFLKKLKTDIDRLQDQIHTLQLQIKDDEIMTHQLRVKVGVQDKLLEDRREDIKALFQKLNQS